MFCDTIIDHGLFGSLVAPHPDDNGHKVRAGPSPLYLMSFVCRPAAYTPEKSVSKYSVPNGLTEEYILKFHYGRWEESDMIDALSEYWYDWGAFGGPIYRYQDVFPWDCTEAYGRCPVKCGNCNITKHVWAFPFDSWSIASLHLSRGRHLYPPCTPLDAATRSGASGVMDDQSWFRNRLTVLLGQRSLLTVATAMARAPRFRAATAWLHRQPRPELDRLKLGGIHRAQPYSHHFEKGAYHLYFLAGWAPLARADQIAKYEVLRDGRTKLAGPPAERESLARRGYAGGDVGSDMVGYMLPQTIAAVIDAAQHHAMDPGSGHHTSGQVAETHLPHLHNAPSHHVGGHHTSGHVWGDHGGCGHHGGFAF
jgi:hypothetical protein